MQIKQKNRLIFHFQTYPAVAVLNTLSQQSPWAGAEMSGEMTGLNAVDKWIRRVSHRPAQPTNAAIPSRRHVWFIAAFAGRHSTRRVEKQLCVEQNEPAKKWNTEWQEIKCY